MAAGRILRAFLVGLLIAGVSAGASLWALASPTFDPVGVAAQHIGAKARAITARHAPESVQAQPDWQSMRLQVQGADAEHGRALIKDYGCGACHSVPGVLGADGTVGPPLSGMADRAYIAGILTNAPGELTRWLINPPYFSQGTAMPDLGVTEGDARDMAAYLYTLGG